jgi:glucose dehydrogenase
VRTHVFIAVVVACASATGFTQERKGSVPASPRGDWSLHSIDLSNSRFSRLDRINASNVGYLALKWSYALDATDTTAQITPLVVGGVMYFNSGSKMFALDAATGKRLWLTEIPDTTLKRGGRGPGYGDGRVYALAENVIYAVDAKTGTPIESFGGRAGLKFVNKALEFKYPGKFPKDLDVNSIGYRLSAPPTYYNGTIYAAVASSDQLINGGLLIAMDGATGAVKWVFTTVPQGPGDDGWEIAKDTWGYGKRVGGGLWNQPALDPELGLIYLNAANASPDYDGTARLGMNLFTNSMIAVHMSTGKMAWYFQTVHHDIWDKDLTNGPILFNITSNGQTVKGVASFGKTCYAYMLDRVTGKPLNPIVETPVPTETDVPGEKPWPTQPIPYTSVGTPQQPFCATYPVGVDAALANRVRPPFHPFMTNELVIISPGLMGGANWGPPSFSPRTGLLYVTGKNDAFSLRVKVVGDSLQPGPNSPGHFQSFSEEGKTGVKASQTVAAYEPVTGRQVWYVEIPGSTTNSGNLVTAGDVVFQGVANGGFYGFDARDGRQLMKFSARTVSSSPMTYEVGGKQYVTFMSGTTVTTLGLP